MAEYGSVRFVDKVGNNLLFRGGAPIENGVYDKDLPGKLKNAYVPLSYRRNSISSSSACCIRTRTTAPLLPQN